MDSVEVREALQEPISSVIDEIKRTLGQTPPELAADIVERGIVMTGGGSLLKGLPKPNKITGEYPDGKKTKQQYHEKACR